MFFNQFYLLTNSIIVSTNIFIYQVRKLNIKNKTKKCNPYKTGPAEWNKVEYVNFNSLNRLDPYSNSKNITTEDRQQASSPS